ncbi:MAG TPA: DUF2279 domain-containing protein [Chitinophagaceae bacterium]
MRFKFSNKQITSSASKQLWLLIFLIPSAISAQFNTGGSPFSSNAISEHWSSSATDSGNPRKGRILLVAGLNTVAYAGSFIALNEAWYKGYPKTSFKTFDDSKEWLQVDKVGHAWSAYSLGKHSSDIWQWAGLPHKKAVLIGGLSGAAYLTVIEFLDAHSARWGWSWADMGANVLGSGLFISQELLWKEQRVQFKFSSNIQSYNASLRPRTDDLFGKSVPEKIFKDYNGQTYWLSFNLKSFFPESRLPSWLNISAGYGADGMLGGFENKWTTDGTVITRYDVNRKRQLYFAPDIDLTKIKTRKKGIRTILSLLNAVKFPAPAIEFSGGKVKGHWLYF